MALATLHPIAKYLCGQRSSSPLSLSLSLSVSLRLCAWICDDRLLIRNPNILAAFAFSVELRKSVNKIETHWFI